MILQTYQRVALSFQRNVGTWYFFAVFMKLPI